MKKYLIFVVGIIIGITGTSYAAYKLKAGEVSFDKTNTELNSDNIQLAIDELATDILTYGDANPNDILEGKTALVNGEKITGTIINRGNLNWNPDSNTTYTVPAGYYTGGVLNSSGAYNAGVNAGKNDVYSNVAIYYVDCGKITSSTTVSVNLSSYNDYLSGKWYILAKGEMTGEGTKNWAIMYVNNGNRYVTASGVASVSVPIYFSGSKGQAILALVHVY